jgi:sugar O-acyltransferase (sialic acid O-acetyltransferase NeuD family)
MRTLVIHGAGGHAKVVAELARLMGWTVVAFLDGVDPTRRGSQFCGAPIITCSDVTEFQAAEVALGFGDNRGRLAAAAQWLKCGWSLPPMVHPRAVLATSARIGEGSQLMAGAIVNPDAMLGKAVIVNTGATVDHDCRIEDGVHLAPGVHLAGDVTVGEGTLVGVGSSVIPGIRIGRSCVIGAGAVVVRDIPDGATAYGVPARIR